MNIKKITISLFIFTLYSIQTYAQFETNINYKLLDSLKELRYDVAYSLKIQQEDIFAATEALHSTQKSWLSSFTIGISSFRYSSDGTVTQVSAFSDIGVTLSLDLYSFTSLNNRIKIARHELRKKELQYFSQQKALERELLGVYSAYLLAVEKLKLLTSQESNQIEILNIVKEKFLRGEAKIDDYLAIEELLEKTRIAKIEAEVASQMAYKELQILTTD
ncbi:TolC family protein [Flammeovirga sp. EKP202]|uniref:TolC family protein n=1 Tax=Flammeovirga sp. EKP202 TaxID=2770592 RepID=UPI00165FD4F8|nr:TolC family protein [Flammeovirga sp. EKP202]MBD0401379.1 TolC family protein [Flammeovirga sp. EKP202]